jgi:hypothetical protein
MILSWVLFISNLLIFGLATLINPSFAFPDSGGTAADFPIQFFAIRHIAFAVPLLHGIIRRNVTILKTMYTIFLVMSVLDVAVLLLNGYYIPIIGELPFLATAVLAVGGFIVPMSLALIYLRRVEDR